MESQQTFLKLKSWKKVFFSEKKKADEKRQSEALKKYLVIVTEKFKFDLFTPENYRKREENSEKKES